MMRNLFTAVRGRQFSIQKSNGATVYTEYQMNRKEWGIYAGTASLLIMGIGFLFYRSILLSILLCPIALFYPRVKKVEIIEKRKNNLNLQFKDLLYSLSSSLFAGKSIESSFADALNDLSILYPDKKTDIIREVETIIRKLEMNETVESALEDFAKRSDLEDIHNFVDVFHICKRTGGNIIEVIKNTSGIINDKIEIKQEIDTLLAQRRFEQKVLNGVPIAMIFLLSLSASDYISPVFTTLQGKVAMTFSIFLLWLSYKLSKKIMEIKV